MITCSGAQNVPDDELPQRGMELGRDESLAAAIATEASVTGLGRWAAENHNQ